MKRNDWILAAGILLFVCLSGAFLYRGRAGGSYVLVRVDGKEYGRYDLLEDQTVRIGETNELRIEDGEAFMIYGDCPDQICVRTAPVSRAHEMIVCMPNRVTAEVLED